MDENSASGKSVGVVVSLKGSVQAVSESGIRGLAKGRLKNKITFFMG
jgi:hypothetical protein